MAKPKQEEIKIVLERNYVIPLRREWLKVPQYKRGKKAIKAVREFLAKHMKVENRDINKITLDRWINEAIWSRGIKRPPQKINVESHPQFQQEWRRVLAQLDSQYLRLLEDYKKEIMSVR